MFNQALPHQTARGRDQHEVEDELAPPSVSEVTLVEVTLLGDLVRILDETKTQHRLRLEEERAANAHRAALVRAQEELARQQAALAEQQKLATAAAIRGWVLASSHAAVEPPKG